MLRSPQPPHAGYNIQRTSYDLHTSCMEIKHRLEMATNTHVYPPDHNYRPTLWYLGKG